MTTKEYLQQIRNIKYKLRRLYERREEIHADMYSLGSPAGRLSHDKVSASISGDKLERLYVRVRTIEKKIDAETERLIKKREIICRQIERVQDEQLKDVLFDRYVKCYRWEEIAERMGVTERYVFMLHGRALQAFEKVKKK